MKIKCNTCKQEKDIKDFSKNNSQYSNQGYQHDCKSCRQEWKLKKKYGITKKQRESIYKDQEGKCLICKQFFLTDDLVVDHNHRNGKVRGLLCSPCNRGIGLLKDNPTTILNAYHYVNKPDQGEK